MDSSDGEFFDDEPVQAVLDFMESIPARVVRSKNGTADFKIERRIARGSFGAVFKAKLRNLYTVALKKVPLTSHNSTQLKRIFKEGQRELKALSSLRGHSNIIRLLEVAADSRAIFICLEYCPKQLYGMIAARGAFPEGVARALLLQLLTGLAVLHKQRIIHRDIKPENLLLKEGVLKIADFGSYASSEPEVVLTPQVVTLWYRPPEILLGSTEYSTSVDIWSSACVFCEMLSSHPLFRGDSQLSQINLIVDCLGTPKDWPQLEDLPAMQCMRLNERQSTFDKTVDKFASEPAKNFLRSILVCNPRNRLTAAECLVDEYFSGSTMKVLSSVEIERWMCNKPEMAVERVRKKLRLSAGDDL